MRYPTPSGQRSDTIIVEASFMYPVLARIGSVEIRSYGVMVALGILASLWVGRREAKRVGIPSRRATDYVMVMGISGTLGLLVHAFPLRFALSGFRATPELDRWTHYGGAIMASILGFALVGGWLYGRIAGIDIGPLRDVAAPGWVLAPAVWRVGCFLNGCCYGKETDSFLGLYAPDVFGRWAYRYPTQLIELVFCLGLCALLMQQRKHKPFTTYLSLLGILLYFSGRFFMSYLRGDNYYVTPYLSEIQLYSLAFMLVSGILLWRRLRALRVSTTQPDQAPVKGSL